MVRSVSMRSGIVANLAGISSRPVCARLRGFVVSIPDWSERIFAKIIKQNQ